MKPYLQHLVLPLCFACAIGDATEGVEFSRSPNFVVLAPDLASAQAVLEKAEQYRREIAHEWLGSELPLGTGPTMISVRFSDDQSRGFSWPVTDASPRQYHRIWVTGADSEITSGLLKHEIAHVVLATTLPGKLAPWIQEGIASQYDDQDRLAARERLIAWYAETGNWPRVSVALADQTFTPDETAAYAVAASLVEFLLTKGDRGTLLQLGAGAGEVGLELAFERHYGITDIEQLQTEWQQWVLKQ